MRNRSLLLIALPLLLCLTLATCGEKSEKTVAAAERTPAAEREIFVAGDAPPNVDVTLVDEDVYVYWDSILLGDYNVDGVVSGLDVFPLAAHFDEAVGDNPGNECIDGNEDAELNGQDLFLIAVNFQQRIDGVNVYLDDEETGAFDALPLNLSLITYEGCYAQQEYSFPYPSGEPCYIALRSRDALNGESSPRSAAAHPQDCPLTPPELLSAFNQPYTNEVQLNWNDSTEPWFASYDVLWAINEDGPWNAINDAPLTESEYIDPGARTVPSYYCLRAVDFYGGVSDPGPAMASPAHGYWYTQIMEEGVNLGRENSVAMASNYDICIAYRDAVNEDLKAYTNTITGAEYWVVDTEGNIGDNPTAAVSPDDEFFISYQNGDGNLTLAQFNGASWDLNVVDTDPTGLYSAIAWDDDGDIWIAYFRSGMLQLKVAHYTGAEWEIEQLGRIDPQRIGMSFNDKGWPVISCVYDGLWVVFDEGSEWVWEEIEYGEYYGDLDWGFKAGGVPGAAWYMSDGMQGEVVWHDGVEWVYEVYVSGGGNTGRTPSMEYSSEGVPYIAYVKSSGEDMMLTWLDEGEWYHVCVDERSGGFPSLVLDKSDRPFMTWYINDGETEGLAMSWWKNH